MYTWQYLHYIMWKCSKEYLTSFLQFLLTHAVECNIPFFNWFVLPHIYLCTIYFQTVWNESLALSNKPQTFSTFGFPDFSGCITNLTEIIFTQQWWKWWMECLMGALGGGGTALSAVTLKYQKYFCPLLGPPPSAWGTPWCSRGTHIF